MVVVVVAVDMMWHY